MDAVMIVMLHDFLSTAFSEWGSPLSPPGIRSLAGIESAAARKDVSFGESDVYPTVFLKAAALFHALINNHPFHNGNKRAALFSMLVFLEKNGYDLSVCPDEEMFEFTCRAAAHEITESRHNEVEAVARWLEKHARPFSPCRPDSASPVFSEPATTELKALLDARRNVMEKLAET